MPLNQPSHHGSVAERSVRQIYFPDGAWESKLGTETSADSRHRIVRVRVCQVIASSREAKMLGREER